MSTVEVEVFEAFKSIGIAPDVAMKAAAALNESRGGDLVRVEAKIDRIDSRVLGLENRVAAIETTLSRHDWMLVFIVGLCVLILGKLLV